jgi:hypothetical protein
MEKPDYVRRQWRRMVWFFRLFPIWIGGIFAYNLWDDRDRTLSEDVVPVFLILCGAVLVFIFSRLIFGFVLGWTEHENRRK